MSNLDFEWDLKKSQTNKAKHGVSFETAQRVFADPVAVLLFDKVVEEEDRWHLIGSPGGAGFTLLLVVHTMKDEHVVRIISARHADARERRFYEEGDY